MADLSRTATLGASPGAIVTGGWVFAQWMRSAADVIIAVGPVYTKAEQDALFGRLPIGARVWRVLIDAPLAVTWERVRNDQQRGLSRQREFQRKAHERFLSLRSGIPTDVVFDSSELDPATIGSALFDLIKVH